MGKYQIMDFNEFINLIENNDIYIYGNGYVGKMFYNALRQKGLKKNVLSFIKTNIDNESCVDDITINTIYNEKIKKNALICVAVHESNVEEIEEILCKLGFENYIWIYPFLFNLMFGLPVEIDKEVDIKSIIKANISDYRLAVRYLAIENYYKKNNYGYDVYIKSMCLHTSYITAKKRLLRFIDLIEEWEKNGYEEFYGICISRDKIILDGIHRFALACYWKMNKIKCDMYPIEGYEECKKIIAKEAFMRKNDILKVVKDVSIINEMDRINNVLKDKYLNHTCI